MSDAAQKKVKVAELLKKLEKAGDQDEKKRLRRSLRALGHFGGLGKRRKAKPKAKAKGKAKGKAKSKSKATPKAKAKSKAKSKGKVVTASANKD